MPIIFDWMDIYKKKARLWKRAAKKWYLKAKEWKEDYARCFVKYENWKTLANNYEAEKIAAYEYLDEIEATATRRLELLKQVEWVENIYNMSLDPWCPSCRQWKKDGHAADCELDKALVSEGGVER